MGLEQLGSREPRDDGGLLPQLAGVRGQAGLGQHVALRNSRGAVGLDDDVVDVRARDDREVGRQGPGRRGPDEEEGTGQCVPHLIRRRGRGRRAPQAHRDSRVLAHLVDLVVHAQLVVGQRRLVRPAVGQDAEALVDEALVEEALEDPEDGLHELRVERLVVVLEVDPAAHAVDVGLPLVGVAQDGFACGLVERLDAHLEDLVLRGESQLAHRLELCGQAVGVPAEAALDLLAPHRLVARDDVLRVAGQQVAVVREAVGERRAVVEDELVLAVLAGLAGLDAGAERVVRLPELEDPLLQVGERRRG